MGVQIHIPSGAIPQEQEEKARKTMYLVAYHKTNKTKVDFKDFPTIATCLCEYIICRSIGEEDKNGTLIYEGAIVQDGYGKECIVCYATESRLKAQINDINDFGYTVLDEKTDFSDKVVIGHCLASE